MLTNVLSTRVKESIKIGLAVALVYPVSMYLGWEKPHWAAIGAVTVNITSAGVSLLRGTIRSTGTLIGAVIALILIAWFPQDRWGFMFSSAVVMAFCTYWMIRKMDILRFSQVMFWFVIGITFIIVAAVVIEPESRYIFLTAWTRTVQTAMGCLMYVLVAAYIWPRTSRYVYRDANQKLSYIQRRLFHHYRSKLLGEQSVADVQPPLRAEEVAALTEARMLLEAAEIDSYKVWEVRRQWRVYHQQSRLLMENYEVALESLDDLKEPRKVLPNLRVFLDEIDQRFEQIQRMLRDESPKHTPRTVDLSVDEAQWRTLSRFEQAVVTMTRERLRRLEFVTGSLYDCMADIRLIKPAPNRPPVVNPLRQPVGLDPDQLRLMIIVASTWILGYLGWIYIYDIPDKILFPMMAGVFGLVVALVPLATMAQLYATWLFGALWAGFFYVFIMQHLSGYYQLGAMIFFAIFVMHYLMWEDRLGLLRAFTMVSFVLILSVANEQTYALEHFGNWFLWLMLSLTVAIACAYMFGSRRPEKMFWRLFKRYFAHATFLLESSNRPPEEPEPWEHRLKRRMYCVDLIDLTGKTIFYANQIDFRYLPDTTPGQFQVRLNSLYTLAYWVKDVAAARAAVAWAKLEPSLQAELRQWHQALEDWFRRSDDPSRTPEQAAAQLAARLDELEARLNVPLTEGEEAGLSADDAVSVYRLLGSYRGLSKAALAYDALPDRDAVDWLWFKEARF